MQSIAVIVPCHNEEKNIPILFSRLQVVFSDLPNYEPIFWFVNDGSSDGTMESIKALQVDNSMVHYIDMSRAFGKEAAMYAGLSHAKADLYTVMDADLQDPPEMIPLMIREIETGYDMVGAARIDRKGEPVIRSLFARLFYRIINRFGTTPIIPGARDFRVMTKEVVKAILSLSERQRFSKGLFSWVGFKAKYLPYENVARKFGKTSWNFFSLLRYSIDGLIDYSEVPLSLVSGLGLVSFVGAFVALVFIIIRALIYGDPTAGWPSLVSIILMVGGLQLFALGIVGRYIGRIFLEVKGRPIYIAREIK